MIFTSRNYAIGMAHYQMAGGLRSLLFLMGTFVVVAATIIGLVLYYADPSSVPRALQGLATLSIVLEGFGLIVIGGMHLANCIRADIMSNMIESHRLMPVSAPNALLGYLFGGNVHILALVLLNVGVLAALQLPSHSFDLQSFVLSQIILFSFALFIWTFSAMGALMTRQAMPLMALVFIVGSIGSVLLQQWGILPGVSILAAPFLGETIFNLARGISLQAAYPLGLAAQMAFSVLFFLGACRRYRGSYLTTFNVPMGLALAAVWGVLSWIAIILWPSVRNPLSREFDQPALGLQIVAALCVAAALLIVPAFALATWEIHHRLAPGRRWLALTAMPLVGAITLLASPFAPGLWLITLLVLAAHVLIVYYALRFCAGFTPMTTTIVLFVLLFSLWLGPLLLEVVRWYFLPENQFELIVHDFSMISTFSPLGVLMSQWDDTFRNPAPMPWLGLAFQFALAAMVARLAARRHRPKTPAISPAPKASSPSS
jgi:hypothetical protein